MEVARQVRCAVQLNQTYRSAHRSRRIAPAIPQIAIGSAKEDYLLFRHRTPWRHEQVPPLYLLQDDLLISGAHAHSQYEQ
jgi:hypothetical protein